MCGWAVRDGQANLPPFDATILLDDKCSWGRDAISQEIINTEGTDCSSFGVRHDWELCSYEGGHLGGVFRTVQTYCHHLHALVSEQWVGLLQLAELPTAYPSKETSIEDQYDRFVLTK